MEEESCRIKPSSHKFKLYRSRVLGIKANAGMLLIARLKAHFQCKNFKPAMRLVNELHCTLLEASVCSYGCILKALLT